MLEGWVPERCPLNSRDPALPEQCVIPGTGRSCTSPRHRAEPCGGKGERGEAGRCSGHDFCSRKADTFECSALPCILRQLKHACGCYRGDSLHWGWLKVFNNWKSLPYLYRISQAVLWKLLLQVFGGFGSRHFQRMCRPWTKHSAHIHVQFRREVLLALVIPTRRVVYRVPKHRPAERYLLTPPLTERLIFGPSKPVIKLSLCRNAGKQKKPSVWGRKANCYALFVL